MVRPVLAGRTPEELAKAFAPTAQAIRNCVRLDGIPFSWPVVRRLGFTVAVQRPPASMGRDPPVRHATQPQHALGRLAIKLFH
jgi:hypothetical protein